MAYDDIAVPLLSVKRDTVTGAILVQLGADANIEIGSVSLLDAGGNEINPAAAYAVGSVFVAAGWGTNLGGVRKDARAALTGVADGDFTVVQFTAAGDLRTRDDDLNTLLAKEAGLAAPANGGSTLNVTNGSATLAAANAARRSLTITNKALTAMLTVTLATPAVSGASAFLLAPAVDATHPGGSVTIDGRDYTGAVYGIMSAADATAGNVGVAEA